MKFKDIPRVQLAFTPTPLQKCQRLADEMGVSRLWLKRDDQTGLALGGNKARKLEYLLAEAVEQQADVVLTVGGPQSNHCRQTVAAARACGMDATLVFSGEEIETVQGNMVLDQLMGAKWVFAGDRDRDEVMEELAENYRKEGRRPYVVPLGGSNRLGAMGYVRAGLELADQCKAEGIDPDYIFLATGSGGTQAGLIMGAYLGGLKARIVGISVSGPKADITERVETILAQLCEYLDVDPAAMAAVEVHDEFVGEGYGRPTELSQRALKSCASLEGVIIDPVYTAKGLGGLLGMLEDGRVSGESSAIFLHSGGSPALFAETDLYWKPNFDISR